MTDFMPESSWTEPAASPSRDFWESTRPAPIQEARASRPSQRAQRRPAAALAADVHELLESMARKRVPRLDAVRQRLQQARAGMQMRGIEDAVHAFHAATTALDFLAALTGTAGSPEFVAQGKALGTCAEHLREGVETFLDRQAVQAPVARLVWIDLVLESGSLHKRVRQGARWLAEMDQDLLARRRGPNTEVTLRAIEELARRGQGMHERLQNVHRLCGHARSVHSLCERIAAERADLCATLQNKVAPAGKRLREELLPLLHAAGYRPLVAAELMPAIDARHELQVVLTQAAAQILRLQEGDRELASQLAWMEEKAGRLA